MTVQPLEPAGLRTLERITLARARVLRELGRHETGAAAAEALGLSRNGLRSHIRDLKEITGATSVAELRKWWRPNRGRWLAEMAQAGGINYGDE